MFILISFCVSMLVAWVMMPWLLKVCYRKGLFDTTNERKVHKVLVPRLGGVIFVPAAGSGIFAALMAASIMKGEDSVSLHLSSAVFTLGVMFVYAVGLMDDLEEVSARIKFLFQLIAVSAFPVCGLYIDSLYGFCGIETIPVYIGYPLSVFISLLIINAINLIDGIDGLAACLSLFGLGVFEYYFYQINLDILCIFVAGFMGVLLAYIPYNLYGKVEKHTKTFMGDSGSLALGVVFAYLVMKYAMVGNPTMPVHRNGLLISYSAVLIPCFDLCRVALRRLSKGRGIFAPDKTHLHHKFLAAGFGMHATLVAIVALQAAMFFMNVLLDSVGLALHWIVLVDVLVFSLVNILLPVEKQHYE